MSALLRIQPTWREEERRLIRPTEEAWRSWLNERDDDRGAGRVIRFPLGSRRAGGAAASAAYLTGNRIAATSDTVSVLNKDIVFVLAFNGATNTIPSEPAGWTTNVTDTRSSSAIRFGHRIATSDAEFSDTGTWTNASRILWMQYRPTNGALSVRGTPVNNNNTGTTVTLDALVSPLATSWGLNFAANVASVTYDSGVTATVRWGPAGSGRTTGLDSNGPCGGTYAAQTITASATTSGHFCVTVEMAVT